jgi:CRISPR-associated protein Csx17
LLRLVFPRKGEFEDSTKIPLIPAIYNHAANGNSETASRLAIRRLRGSDFSPALDTFYFGKDATRRIAAAMLFPLSRRDFARLMELILKPKTEKQTKP